MPRPAHPLLQSAMSGAQLHEVLLPQLGLCPEEPCPSLCIRCRERGGREGERREGGRERGREEGGREGGREGVSGTTL